MELLADLLMPSLWAFLACVGFGLVYNIQGAGILICGFGGALGWFFYLKMCIRDRLFPDGRRCWTFFRTRGTEHCHGGADPEQAPL